jgi:hypothetical protein
MSLVPMADMLPTTHDDMSGKLNILESAWTCDWRFCGSIPTIPEHLGTLRLPY